MLIESASNRSSRHNGWCMKRFARTTVERCSWGDWQHKGNIQILTSLSYKAIQRILIFWALYHASLAQGLLWKNPTHDFLTLVKFNFNFLLHLLHDLHYFLVILSELNEQINIHKCTTSRSAVSSGLITSLIYYNSLVLRYSDSLFSHRSSFELHAQEIFHQIIFHINISSDSWTYHTISILRETITLFVRF